MIILDIPQGTTEWLIERLFRLTGSELNRCVTSTGKLSKSEASVKHVDKLIAGITLANIMIKKRAEIDEMDDWELLKFMSHYIGERFKGSAHTLRGHDTEPTTIAAMSQRIGSQIETVGMVVMGDKPNGVVSCSPDGFVYQGGKVIAGAEAKAPCLCNFYPHAVNREVPKEYSLQIHSGMAICDVDTWHFGSLFDDGSGDAPLFHQKATRNKFTDTLQASLVEFHGFYRERYAVVTEALEELRALAAATPEPEESLI